MHRRQHFRVLAHAEIVVGTPHRNLATTVAAMVHRPREMTGSAFEIGKNAVASLAPQLTQLPLEKSLVIHDPPVPQKMVCSFLSPAAPSPRPLPPPAGERVGKGLKLSVRLDQP